MNQFKLRASAGGKLATAPLNKSKSLSETSKTYLKQWLIEQTYGYKNIITNKYVERGINEEDKAIDKAIELLDLPFSIKNEITFENDYFIGTPDLIIDDVVYDIKTSWSCFTFPLFEKEIPNKDYYYQLQIYMNLLSIKKAKLVYVLLDNESIKHIYSNDCKRIKVFDIDYNEDEINNLTKKVVDARMYIDNLIESC